MAGLEVVAISNRPGPLQENMEDMVCRMVSPVHMPQELEVGHNSDPVEVIRQLCLLELPEAHMVQEEAELLQMARLPTTEAQEPEGSSLSRNTRQQSEVSDF
jgi:hypothetical protein